ncbi:hypothetical protein G4B88_004937 [Cannabis sativa]|uniref:Retrotransposon gag domain-containing protein n=1 Tax=Cannabis sativa TaxID=3483 RepID=A0A7J6EC33_CANSA|nr:hypothetical protein G4B88_004937 [Cannabis sativa]
MRSLGRGCNKEMVLVSNDIPAADSVSNKTLQGIELKWEIHALLLCQWRIITLPATMLSMDSSASSFHNEVDLEMMLGPRCGSLMLGEVESHERGIAVISEKLDLLLRGQARMATELTDGPRSPIGRSVQPPIGSSGAGSHNRDETGGYRGRRPKFRPRNIELPLFAGSDPDDWKYRAERYFRLQRLTAEEQLEAAVLCLEGPALRWFRWENRRREIRNWGELKDLVLRRFLPAHEGSAYDRFLALQQTSTVQEYRQQFEALTASLGAVAEPLLESAFLKGLNSEIQGTLRLLEPVGLEKTMELAEIVEANPKVVRAFGSGPSKGVISDESPNHALSPSRDQSTSLN